VRCRDSDTVDNRAVPLASTVRLTRGAEVPGGERNQAYPMHDLRQLRHNVIAARRAYNTLCHALNALPPDHPTTQPLAELVAVAARYWHEAQLVLDAARAATARGPRVPRG
jgi:hypothetical protein